MRTAHRTSAAPAAPVHCVSRLLSVSLCPRLPCVTAGVHRGPVRRAARRSAWHAVQVVCHCHGRHGLVLLASPQAHPRRRGAARPPRDQHPLHPGACPAQCRSAAGVWQTTPEQCFECCPCTAPEMIQQQTPLLDFRVTRQMLRAAKRHETYPPPPTAGCPRQACAQQCRCLPCLHPCPDQPCAACRCCGMTRATTWKSVVAGPPTTTTLRRLCGRTALTRGYAAPSMIPHAAPRSAIPVAMLGNVAPVPLP